MKELMIHVEQIVRPVRAFASRKLRMRHELLAHLQAALDEERAVDGKELAALERAKNRLGEPHELTQTLQQSVPWIEQKLMSRLPIPHAVERWEIRSFNWRKDCPLTLMQSTLLVIGAPILPFIGVMMLVAGVKLDRQAAQLIMFDRPMVGAVMNVGSIVLTLYAVAICARFIVAIASLQNPWRTLKVQAFAAGIIILPLLYIELVLICVNRRAAGARELLLSFVVGFGVLASQIIVGRLIATLRRPYAAWLSLDIAG